MLLESRSFGGTGVERRPLLLRPAWRMGKFYACPVAPALLLRSLQPADPPPSGSRPLVAGLGGSSGAWSWPPALRVFVPQATRGRAKPRSKTNAKRPGEAPPSREVACRERRRPEGEAGNCEPGKGASRWWALLSIASTSGLKFGAGG